ncbi:MAG: cell division protein FtsQ/DivIB [Thermochromatium sp.]
MTPTSSKSAVRHPDDPARPSRRLYALLGILALAMLGGGGWWLLRWEAVLLPIRVIQVEGEVHHHSSQQLQERLTARLRGGILTADLVDLKQTAEALPWVGQATVQRIWPDTLRVKVQEYRPVARWNADGLVTAEGIVFRPQDSSLPSHLPRLEGQDDARAPEITARYLEWRSAFERIGQMIQTLSVDPRGDWRLTLLSGTELRLGTTMIEERLARYLTTASQLEAVGRPLTVDLRYSNGFAVKWSPNTDTGGRVYPDRVATRLGSRG